MMRRANSNQQIDGIKQTKIISNRRIFSATTFDPTRRSMSPEVNSHSLRKKDNSEILNLLSQLGIKVMATSIDLSNFNLELNLTKQLEHQLRGMLEGICTCIMVKCSLITYPSLLTSMPYLKDLDLSHNTLTDIKWSVGQLPLLQKLNLSHNFIMELPTEFKHSAKHLQELNLCENHIKSLICTQGMRLIKLDLTCNPLIALCQCISTVPQLESEWNTYLKYHCVSMELITYIRNEKNADLLMVKACQQAHLGTIDSLLTHRPDLIHLQVKYIEKRKDQQVECVETLVQHCYRKQFTRAYKVMVDHGALQHSKNGLLAETQLHPLLSLSVQRLDLENMNRLLNLGISPTKADFADNSLLHLLFEVFDSEPHLAALIATKLLFYGIDPNKPNATNWAPLHVAALGCQVEAIKWAIQYNKGLGQPKFQFDQVGGKHGQTILHIAANQGNQRIVMLAQEMQLSTLQTNDQGYNARQVAATNKGVLKLLRRLERLEVRTILRRHPGKHCIQKQKAVVPSHKNHKKSTSVQIQMEDYSVLSNSSTESHRRTVGNFVPYYPII